MNVFPNLEHLYWQISDIDDYSDFMSQKVNILHTLKIEDCNILSFNDMIEKLTNLEVLQVDFISWPTEQLQLDKLVNLKYLDLSGTFNNCLLSLKNLRDLVVLNLYNCTLEENCFEDLSNLESLFLYKVNNVKLSTFKSLPKLKQLYLIDCDISEIDFSAQNEFLPNLKYLGLKCNQVAHLSEATFSSLKSLKYLDLSDNHIRKLDVNVFNGLGNLFYLNLSGNPLNRIEETLENLKKLNIKIVFKN